nr:MAG TPA: hypothetical protein [Caudoviricetes sp.]
MDRALDGTNGQPYKPANRSRLLPFTGTSVQRQTTTTNR